MIKQNIIAVIITALLIQTNIANAVEIHDKYGNKINIYGSINMLRKFSKDEYYTGDKSYTRLGLKNEHYISDNIIGYSEWKYNFQNQFSESNMEGPAYDNATCLAYAGLNFKKWGSIDYGRNYGILYDTLSYTNKLPVGKELTMKNNDNYLSGRATSLITYRNKNLFGYLKGMNLAVQYLGKNLHDRDESEKNNNGWGGSLEYKSKIGISTVGSWFSVNRTNKQKEDANGDKSIVYALGLKYDKNNIYLGAMYGNAQNLHRIYNLYYAKQTKNIELIAQYTFKNKISPSIAFLQKKTYNIGTVMGYANGDNVAIIKYINLGATYNVNKNVSAYADYKLNLINKDDNFVQVDQDSVEDIFSIGMSYKF